MELHAGFSSVCSNGRSPRRRKCLHATANGKSAESTATHMLRGSDWVIARLLGEASDPTTSSIRYDVRAAKD